MSYAGGEEAAPRGAVSDDLLLEVLRQRASAPGLRYAAPPERMTGGFWAEIIAIRLEGGPSALNRDLVVRMMPDSGIAERETVIQQEVVSQGFPAPAVRLVGEADAGLGRPFMVMDRVPGRPPLPDIGGPAGLAALGRAAIRLPDLLAGVSARLHALDPAPLRQKLNAVGVGLADVADLLSLLQSRAGEVERPDLVAAAERMPAVRPVSEREAICHGDLHPFNLLVDEEHVTLIDWSVALVADPAFDLAFTAMTMAMAPIDVPRALRRPVRAAARAGSRQFLRRYRRLAPHADRSLNDDVMAWHAAVHCLRALVEVAQWVADGTADDHASHPWLVMGPQLAVRLGAVVDTPVRPM